MTSKLRILGACALLLLGACAAPGPVQPPSDRFGLSAQPQVHVVHHPPRRAFLSDTGFIYADVFRSQAIQKNLALQDPVTHVKDRLIATLQRDIGLKNLRAVPDVSSDGTIDTFKERYPSGAVLELRTYGWGMEYNLVTKYAASAYLTNLADSKLLWSTTCEWVILDKDKLSPDNAVDDAALRQALYANNGALLKAKLREAAEICADQIALRLMSPGDHRRKK